MVYNSAAFVVCRQSLDIVFVGPDLDRSVGLVSGRGSADTAERIGAVIGSAVGLAFAEN